VASGCDGCAIEDLLVGILDSFKVASLEHGSPGSLCRTIKGVSGANEMPSVARPPSGALSDTTKAV